MTLPVIATLPTAPARTQDSTTFSANADAMVAALATLVSDINAWSAAVPGEVNPANYLATSSTSMAIGTGSKSPTVDLNKLFYVGQFLGLYSTASPTNYMVGQVTSYTAGTGALVVNVLYTGGSGTIASWTIGPVPAPATTFNPRAVTDAGTSGTLTPTSATADLYIMTGLTGTTTIAAPSGTPVEGQKLMLRIKDSGSTRSLVWNAIYRVFGSIVLPTSTTAGKWLYVGLVYNSADTKWDVLAVSQQP